jgi:hypothetical protein
MHISFLSFKIDAHIVSWESSLFYVQFIWNLLSCWLIAFNNNKINEFRAFLKFSFIVKEFLTEGKIIKKYV